MRTRKSIIGFAGAISLCLAAAGFCGVFTVVNTEDSGPGSLRQAILDANNQAGPDTIGFDIPETGSVFNGSCWFIEPFSDLPELTDDGTVIDGTTQTALHGETNPNGPEVYLMGYQAKNGYPVSWGLTIQSSNNVIRGLIVSCFNGTAITISGDGARYNRIEGNYIGTNFGGSDTLESPNGKGIRISEGAKHNTVGGSSVEERNLISGNRSEGVYIIDADSNRVIGNTIGTNITGTQPLGNGSDGIRILEGSNNEIGGFREGEGNLISGNKFYGLVIRGEDADSNVVVGNVIGVDVTGARSLGNGEQGISIESGAKDNRIGGALEGEANVISGNGRHGILITGTGTDGTRIIGNAIGTDAGGTVSLGNGWEGIYISDGSQRTVIGPDNIIANNGFNGFYVEGENTLFHTITRNRIYNNQEAGIKIDGGGNMELAPPVLAGLNPVSGTAVPNGRVEIFSDSSDEGRIYEGFTTADGSGNFNWDGSPVGPNVTATATDANGNTSEFSAALETGSGVESNRVIPEQFSLAQNYPNPFNPSTKIRFDVKEPCRVVLKVYDIGGREVRTLTDEEYGIGRHILHFDASSLSSGIYLYQIQMGNFTAARKMVLSR